MPTDASSTPLGVPAGYLSSTEYKMGLAKLHVFVGVSFHFSLPRFLSRSIGHLRFDVRPCLEVVLGPVVRYPHTPISILSNSAGHC